MPAHLGVYDPTRLGVPVPLVDLLGVNTTAWHNLVDERRLCLSDDEYGALLEGSSGPVVPNTDPRLARSASDYRDFVFSHALLLAWTRSPCDRVGIFFVKKKADKYTPKNVNRWWTTAEWEYVWIQEARPVVVGLALGGRA